MQEEVEEKVKQFAISTTKLTGKGIVKAFYAAEHGVKNHHARQKARKAEEAAEIPHGKQTVKQLVGQNQGVQAIDINNTGIRDFEKYANRFGVDYAITKNKSMNPPVYTVFFKGRDADAINRAFEAYSYDVLNRQDKPSILKQLRNLVEKARDKAHGPFEKNREKNRSTEEAR